MKQLIVPILIFLAFCSFVIFVVRPIVHSLTAQGKLEEYIELNCEPAPNLYVRTSKHGWRPVYRCNDE